MRSIKGYRINAGMDSVDIWVKRNEANSFLHVHVNSRTKTAFITSTDNGHDRLFKEWPDNADTLSVSRRKLSELTESCDIPPIMQAAIDEFCRIADSLESGRDLRQDA